MLSHFYMYVDGDKFTLSYYMVNEATDACF